VLFTLLPAVSLFAATAITPVPAEIRRDSRIAIQRRHFGPKPPIALGIHHKPVKTLDPVRALWREAVKLLPIVDILSGVLRDRYGCWGFIDLWRGHGPVFSDDDAMFLGSLLDQLTAAQRSRVAGMFGFATSAPDDRGPALVLLDDNLRPVTETPAAEQSLRRLLPTDPRDAPIPAAALNVAAQLLASERGIDTSPARARMHSHDGAWVDIAGRPTTALTRDDGGVHRGDHRFDQTCRSGRRVRSRPRVHQTGDRRRC
jgi:hypothetical protein